VLKEPLAETCEQFLIARKDYTFLELQRATWRKIYYGFSKSEEGWGGVVVHESEEGRKKRSDDHHHLKETYLVEVRG